MKHPILLVSAMIHLALAPAAHGQLPVLPSVAADLSKASGKVDLSGYVAVRGDWSGDTLGFSVSRARLTAQVRPRPFVGARMQMDFAAFGSEDSDSTVSPFALTDAFIQLELPRDTAKRRPVQPRLLLGQMRIPFGLERITSFTDLLTIDRSQASNRIAFPRDVGVVAEVAVASYALVSAAWVNGEGPDVFKNPDGRYLTTLRVGVSPAAPLGIGAKVASQGQDRRWGTDVRFVPSRLVVEGEYLERRDGSPVPALHARGGYVLVAYRVTSWLQPLVKVEGYSEGDVEQNATTLGINLLQSRAGLRLQCNAVFPSADSQRPGTQLITQAILRF